MSQSPASSKAHNLILRVLTILIGASNCPAASILPVSPPDGTTIETPLSAKLTWSKTDTAVSYRLTLLMADSNKPVLEVNSIRATDCPVPLRPDTSYQWSVTAINATGETVASGGPFSFKTPPVVLKEVTDPAVMFKGWHTEAHFVETDLQPIDPTAAVSPWFYKKTYDHAAPPSYDQIKSLLAIPIWDGHDEAIEMYWYSWKTLFSVWLYPPNAKSDAAVSNMLGCPTWAGWGSTMLWDSAFIIYFARYAHRAYPVIDTLDNCYARQHENGFICREAENGNREVNSTWPVNLPLLAWAEWGGYQISADVERLRKVFMPLVKNYEWTMLNMRRSNGLYWNKGMGDGMDDNPRNALADSYVSFTSVMAMTADTLSQMAKLLGRDDLADWFTGDFANFTKLINDNFWDAQYRLYNDLGADGKPITNTPKGGICKHIGGFWPMIAGVTSPDRFASLFVHLSDPKTFNRSSGTASLSADSNHYNVDQGSYWRGGVWPPTQYMVIKGLEKCGNEELAYNLASKYFTAFLLAFYTGSDIKQIKDITEFVAPDKPRMYGSPKFVGWGGLTPIAILFEDLFGIRVDAPANTIIWKIRCTDRHGVQNLAFSNRIVTLICEARKAANDPCTLNIVSDGEFELVLERPGNTVQKIIPAGCTTFLF
jgi:hypothetical protein